MDIKVNVNYPDKMEELYDKAADILSRILIKKLQPDEVNKLIEVLKDDSKDIKI